MMHASSAAIVKLACFQTHAGLLAVQDPPEVREAARENGDTAFQQGLPFFEHRNALGEVVEIIHLPFDAAEDVQHFVDFVHGDSPPNCRGLPEGNPRQMG